MSQVVGQVFKSRIPTLGDDASIEEALRVYHYGVDNYTTQPIPNDSIEGNFRTLDTRVETIETSLEVGLAEYIRRVSIVSAPNIITPESTTTIPLVIRAIASQTSNLQQWQDSASNVVARISTAGSFGSAGYGSFGSVTTSSSIALSTNIISSSHKGIIVKAAPGQTANLQEWQDSSGTVLSWVEKDGKMYSQNREVATDVLSSFLLIGV